MPPASSIHKGVADIVDQLADLHPQAWASKVYEYLPLGKRKGMLSMHTGKLGIERTDSQVYNYFEKPFNQRTGTVLDVYDGPGLTNATTTTAANAVRNIAMTANQAKMWNVNDRVLFTNAASNAYTRIVGRVVDVVVLGDTTSYISCIFPVADTANVLASGTLYFDPSSAQFPNKTMLPSVRIEKPTKFTCVCSNRLSAWGLTIHEIKEKSRLSKSVRATAIEDAMKDLLIADEIGAMFGPLDDTDPTQYGSQGLWDVLNSRTSGGTNIINFATDTNYMGSVTGSFVQLGYQLLRDIGEYCSRNVGQGSWNVYCGGLALEAVNAMIVERSNHEITTKSDDYGFNFTTIHTMRGDFNFYAHPLFANAPAFQRMMVGVRPELITPRHFFPIDYIEPAQFSKLLEGSGSGVKVDGQNWSTEQKGGWFECKGYEFYNADAHFFLDAVSLDIDRT